jgi:hypothetical protein
VCLEHTKIGLVWFALTFYVLQLLLTKTIFQSNRKQFFTVIMGSSHCECSVVQCSDVAVVSQLDRNRTSDVPELLGSPPTTVSTIIKSLNLKKLLEILRLF